MGKRTQDYVRPFEYLNESSSNENSGSSFQGSRISRDNLDDSDTPCKQLQRTTIDEFPSKQTRTQELSYPMSDVGKTDTNATMKPKGRVVVEDEKQGPQYLEYPHTSSHDPSGGKGRPRKEVPLNDRRTGLKEGDESSTPPLIRSNQNIEDKFDNETRVFLTYPKRIKKAGITRPKGRAPQTDLPTTSRNDEDNTLPMIRTNRNCNGMPHDTDDSCEESQPKNETDLATSIRSSSQEDAKTGTNNAKMDTTLATEASFSIRGNMVLSAGPQKKYFYDMWMKGKFCDVNIVVEDHAFLAHRVVLAANSEYFEKFFLNTPAKTDILTVYISDISADVFRDILRYMYTGDVDIQFVHVSQLLRGSLFLSIKSLTNALQTFLLNTWKGECIGAFCLAQTTGLHDLLREILNYIRTHFVEVSTSRNFALCPVEHASCILKDDNLRINEETDILHAVLLWLEHHTRDTSSNLRLLRHVRFEYIPLKTIERIEKSHLNSISNESVRRYIQDARKRASCLEIDQLHFDPPIIRQRIAEVVGCRASRIIDSESITAKNSDRFYKTSDEEERISSSKEEQTPSYSQGGLSLSSIEKSPSSTKSSKSLNTKAGTFPSYHDIDTTPIRVSVSQDVSASPVASNDDLGESSSQESTEDETTIQVVRIGGISRTWDEDSVHSDIEKLDRGRGKRWEEWISFADLPVAMHHQAACYIHNSIYISGGHVQLPCDASCNNFQPSRLFHVYDLMKAKWYRLADLDQARVFHQMVALFGQIYVIGGQGQDGGALAAVDRYSPYTDSWRQVAPLSSPRYATAAAPYNFHLWVAGGATNHVTNRRGQSSQSADESKESGDEKGASVFDGFYKSSNTQLTGIVECYSPHDNSWSKINGLPTPRCHASLLRINQRLFLVGGFTCIRHFPDDDSSTSSVDVYDDVTESWRYVTDVVEGNYGANAVAVGPKIVVLGKPGPFLESDGDVISIFDTATDKWELRRSLLLESRVGHACCAIPVSLHSPLRRA
ncbi:kelch-like protein 2 [Strongylocentrotus purpuratus]|uniref:BTB domain-containing protein n=1 Tax=Strongylocentrotus purpuratus TaxID=7668 RepID=A0A7M7GRJ5_STRPU|nr:kelch-like protein 2 [Strongylocentrotus purpuratus]